MVESFRPPAPCPAVPELPEVETMVRGVRPALLGRRINGFSICDCPCRPCLLSPELPDIARRARNQKVSSVRRRAKRIVIELASGDHFVIEPRMTGLLLLADPPDEGHLRFEWRMEGGQSVWFWDRRGLGTCRLLSREEYHETVEARLGPDALEMTPELWRAACRQTGRPIKVALLDQKLVAGIGNLYASEILHLAAIHPATPASRLSRVQIGRLAAMTKQVLDAAILHEGSTLGDGTYRNVLNQDGGYQNCHRVYDREGELCPTCGHSRVQRIVQAQRSTFWCRVCQKKR